MRKKIFVILVVVITLINAVSALYIFINIQMLKTPNITFKMEIVEINSNEMIIHSTLDVDNPNNFEMITKNIALVTMTSDGTEVGNMYIEGGVIASNGNRTYNDTYCMNFKSHIPERLNTMISGAVGTRFCFLELTIPLSVNVVTVIDDIVENFVPPETNIQVDFDDITQRKINITITVEMFNSNSFDIEIDDLSFVIQNETGGIVGEITIPGTRLLTNTTTDFKGHGSVIIEILNSEKTIIDMNSEITAFIAGFEKVLPFNVKTTINSPDLKSILPGSTPTFAIIRGDFRAGIFGLIDEETLEVVNPNNIEFIVKDITLSIARIDRNTKRIVASGEIKDGIIKPNGTTVLKGSMIIPYRKLFIPPLGGRIIPNWLEIILKANVTIQGLDDYFWVGLKAYQDFHPLRRDRVYKEPIIVDWF